MKFLKRGPPGGGGGADRAKREKNFGVTLSNPLKLCNHQASLFLKMGGTKISLTRVQAEIYTQ